MLKIYFSRLLNIPILFFFLLLLTLGLGFQWVKQYQSLDAPRIAGWNWSQHPNTLLVCYHPSACGCGPGVHDVAVQGRSHGTDVLVVSALDADDARILRSDLLPTHAYVITTAAAKMMQALSPTGKTTMTVVKNGHMVRRTTRFLTPDFLN